MYVNFTQSASEVMGLRRAMEQGRLKRAAGREGVLVRVVLEDGTEYPQPGRLLFSDLTVDATSGQITLRADVVRRSDAQCLHRAAGFCVVGGAVHPGAGQRGRGQPARRAIPVGAAAVARGSRRLPRRSGAAPRRQRVLIETAPVSPPVTA